jgi:transposase
MKLTFIPGPDSPWRVIAADDEQPPESWAEWVTPPPSAQPAPAAPVPLPPLAPETSPAGQAAFLGPLPPLSCPDCPDRSQFYQARQQAGYYRALFDAAKKREADLQARIAELEAENRILKQRLFGSKSEARHSPDRLTGASAADPLAEDASASPEASSPAGSASTSAPATPPRSRGQQRGGKHPARRDYSHLPVVTEECVLPPDQACCPCCQQPFAPAGFDEDTSVIEVEVKAYRRVIRRRRYRRVCTCPDQPIIFVPPVAPRVIPSSRFGVSFWVHVLLDKFHYYRPTARLLDDLRSCGLDVSAGTITDDLKRLAFLFEPLYLKLIDRNRTLTLWGADETRWPVFQIVEGKVGYRWYMWLVESKDAVVFILDKGRAHDVPEDHFGATAMGIVVVDRYSAYKAMKHVKEGRLRLAFCWAHQRRDFLDVEKSWPKLSDWVVGWVARIAELYKWNHERLAAKAQEKNQDFTEKNKKLKEAVAAMSKQRDEELADEKLHPAKKKVLQSMKEHWEGLTVFVDEPHVPMDNNQSERTLRKAALARKNYYGSGAEWSGKLAAWMFSILATLKKWRINPRKWLLWYLQACAEAGGQVPKDAENFLPWKLTEEQRKEMAQVGEEDEGKEATERQE